MLDPLLALWQTQPEAAAAFGGPAAAPPPATVWRRDLPEDGEEAGARLEDIARTIRLAEEANAAAPHRLKTLVETRTGPAAFVAAAAPPPLPEPERALLALLQPPPQAVAFAWAPRGGWAQAAEEVHAFLQGIQRFVAHYAWVETAVGGHLVARTVVAWDGDFQTQWEQPLPPGAATMHEGALRLALASRIALLRTVAVLLSGALLVLPLAAGPSGVIAALPAVWRFLQRLRDELARTETTRSLE